MCVCVCVCGYGYVCVHVSMCVWGRGGGGGVYACACVCAYDCIVAGYYLSIVIAIRLRLSVDMYIFHILRVTGCL